MSEETRMKDELRGQVAIITGGGRGFGRAIAEGFAAAGAAVAVTARTQTELDEVAAAIKAAGGLAIATAGDVTSQGDAERVVKETESRLGPVSILVHNAGVPWPFGPLWYVDPARWWEAQAVHVGGAVNYIHAAVPGMVERRNGRVIIVASGAGTRAIPNLSGYSVAKHTQMRLAETLALEGKEHGLFAFAISPGDVITDLSYLTVNDPDAQRYIPWFVDRLRTRMAANEDGTPGLLRCAELCVKLASGACDSLSGRFLAPTDDLEAMVRDAATTSSPEPQNLRTGA
jgi:NAD(P)-dependent dehydrogenase (short-subunit alcohol dehydrogenase family)